jgi:phytoene dehydrogenase-like protein
MTSTVQSERTTAGESIREYDAIVVGAGFSGLYQLHKLRNGLGLKVRVLEAAEGIGGTWYWNRYPGARCDSESYYYSYSFSRELEQEWEWTERYPEHGEIRKYLHFVAERLNLMPDIQLGTRVSSARFDDATDRWTITTESGRGVPGAVLHPGRRLPLFDECAEPARARELRRQVVPHGAVAPRRRRLHGQARRAHRHGLDGNPGGPGDRRRRPRTSRYSSARRTIASRRATDR